MQKNIHFHGTQIARRQPSSTYTKPYRLHFKKIPNPTNLYSGIFQLKIPQQNKKPKGKYFTPLPSFLYNPNIKSGNIPKSNEIFEKRQIGKEIVLNKFNDFIEVLGNETRNCKHWN